MKKVWRKKMFSLKSMTKLEDLTVCDEIDPQSCVCFMKFAMILNPVGVYVVCDDPLILLKYTRMYDTSSVCVLRCMR